MQTILLLSDLFFKSLASLCEDDISLFVVIELLFKGRKIGSVVL